MSGRASPLRVLVVRHGYYPEDPRVRREVRALASRGHHVDVVCLRDEDQAASESVAGANVTRLPVRHRRAGPLRYLFEYGAFGLLAAWTVSIRHLRRRYDVVQVNTMPDALVFAAFAPKLMGTPVLLDLHEVMPELYASKFRVPMSHPLPRALAWVEREATRFADACLAVSDPCLERYAARGAERDKFTVVMNTADPALFGRSRVPTAAAPHGPPMVVSHGTLVERYGFDVLLTALADVPETRLEIIGDGEARPALERLAQELNLSGRVSFSGRLPIEEVARRLSGAYVGVVANLSDDFTDLVVPTKLMEYVAVGIPAIAARTPAIEDYFDERAVAFFGAGDPVDLARALSDVLASPSRRREMVACADRQFGAVYGGDVMQRRYAALIESLGGDPCDSDATAPDLRRPGG